MTKFKEKLFGCHKRYSQFSGLCGECADIIAYLVTLSETSEHVRKYGNDVSKIQEYCIYEKCEKALEMAKRVKSDILRYFSPQEISKKENSQEYDFYNFW